MSESLDGMYEIGSGFVTTPQALHDLQAMLSSDNSRERGVAMAWAHYARELLSGNVPGGATCVSASEAVSDVRVAIYDYGNATLIPVSDGCFDDMAEFVLVDDDEDDEDGYDYLG